MAGTVSRLEYQKRNRDRVNVYLDGKFAFGLPELEAAKLKEGQFLTDEDIAGLRETDAAQKAYDRAVRFLSYRPRSRAEVVRNLADAGTEQGIIQAVIERLARQGYLNDAEFAQFWVENRERFGPRGEQALRQELRQKGLDDETVAEALADLDPVESARRAAVPRARRMAELARSDSRTFRRRLGSYLVRRGFSYDVVKEVVTRLERELNES